MSRVVEKKTVVEPLKHELIKKTSAFCNDKLDDEYCDLCVKMIEKMSRKK